MSIKSEYNIYKNLQNKIKSKNTSKFWFNQENRYVNPFQIYGNLYYVGDSWVCVHIVDTGHGLLMFDAGNCGGEAMLIHSIWKLGFNPEDVKWIILSHGHVDHFGAVNFFKRMFGTKIYIGKPDAEIGYNDFNMRKLYLQSLKKVWNEKVDIFMGNHTSNINLLEKRRYMLENPNKNPFIDSFDWKKYLNSKYNELMELINSEIN